jgi:DNA invertase Pin-like site-specific DNA recombinase
VSSLDQHLDRQLEGVQVDVVFEEKVSGSSTERPQLRAMLDYLTSGDTLLVHSLDRLARNTEDLLRLVRELTARDITVVFVKNQLTFGGERDVFAKLMLTMLGAFAEFERELIRERQREGINVAKKKGKYDKLRVLTPAQAEELRHKAAVPGVNKSALARYFKISRETMYQYLKGNV